MAFVWESSKAESQKSSPSTSMFMGIVRKAPKPKDTNTEAKRVQEPSSPFLIQSDEKTNGLVNKS
jgi:hypothetical protein